MQHITILGATGSIGVSTLDVVARHPDRYTVYALTAHGRVEELAVQCERHHPQVAVVGSADAAQRLSRLLNQKGSKTQVEYGEAALCAVAGASGCDVVMAAIVGAAGLAPTLAAAKAGKKVLLANKEALVMSGQLFMDAVTASGAMLLPIDSEHNAIFQCLPHNYQRSPAQHGIAKILLTASGGPFLNRAIDTLTSVTPEEAVAHPNWIMGRKISVDSATMMNKGLEVIEASYLFALTPDEIDVLVHPQSIVHGMVEFSDCSVVAQLGAPDMRTPIAHCLGWPDRIVGPAAKLDLAKIGQLTFEAPDFGRFPGLRLAYDALRTGRGATTVYNAANEIAVAAFIAGKIRFGAIARLVEATMEAWIRSGNLAPLTSADDAIAIDHNARNKAATLLPQIALKAS